MKEERRKGRERKSQEEEGVTDPQEVNLLKDY